MAAGDEYKPLAFFLAILVLVLAVRPTDFLLQISSFVALIYMGISKGYLLSQ